MFIASYKLTNNLEVEMKVESFLMILTIPWSVAEKEHCHCTDENKRHVDIFGLLTVTLGTS